MENTKIAWASNTFNCWLGCTEVSPGCDACYARELTRRYGQDVWGHKVPRHRTSASYWKQPFKWDKAAAKAGIRTGVFCASLADWADAEIPREWVDDLWDLIRATPNLRWMLLTKRPGRIMQLLPPDWGEGWPWVWLGTSVENADYVWRAETLANVPCLTRFISYEPAIGPIADVINLDGISWLIYGGESGKGYRPMDIQWARDIRAKCDAEGVAFFFKQSAAPRTEMGIHLDGEIVRNFPPEKFSKTEELMLAIPGFC